MSGTNGDKMNRIAHVDLGEPVYVEISYNAVMHTIWSDGEIYANGRPVYIEPFNVRLIELLYF
jgi:hypothetical protein